METSPLILNSSSSASASSSSPRTRSNSNSVKAHFHFHMPHLGKMHHSLHLHLPHLTSKKGGGHHDVSSKKGGGHHDVPKGCLALYVGQGQQQQRFVVPVVYVNHPLFEKLLKEAEEEYGFEQKGTITIPCHVSHFQHVQELIDQERHRSHAHGGCFF